jgi:hypothetical protein
MCCGCVNVRQLVMFSLLQLLGVTEPLKYIIPCSDDCSEVLKVDDVKSLG